MLDMDVKHTTIFIKDAIMDFKQVTVDHVYYGKAEPWVCLADVFSRQLKAIGPYSGIIHKYGFKLNNDTAIGFLYTHELTGQSYYLFWAGSEKCVAIDANQFKFADN